MAFRKLSNFISHQADYDPMVDKLNEMVRAINTILPIVGSGGVTVSQINGTGTAIGYTPGPYPSQIVGVTPVLLTQNGGANGNATTKATYTYDAYAISDTSKATKLNGSTPLNVIMQRPVGLVIVAINGLMANQSGTNVLIWVDETPQTGTC